MTDTPNPPALTPLVNTAPRTACLQGEPGSGKSMMAVKTAVHQPVHAIDVDRKLHSAGWAQPWLSAGKLTVWPLNAQLDRSNLKDAIAALVAKEKPRLAPQGWSQLAELTYRLATDPVALAAGTWLVDSLTLANEHLKEHIMFLANKGKFAWDQWNALKIGWMGWFSVARDLAIEHHKDLIVTVHERTVGEVGDRVTGVKTETVASPTEGISQVRTFQGIQDVGIIASIDGAFGQLIGAQTDEYYHLKVKMEGGKPKWICRIHPDGQRNLRTSFIHEQSEFEPDFRKIWK